MSFSYDGKNKIFENLDISAVMDSRIAVVGENGSGKTTLLKILLGDLEPVGGIRQTHRCVFFLCSFFFNCNCYLNRKWPFIRVHVNPTMSFVLFRLH